MELLEAKRDAVSVDAYKKYYHRATDLYVDAHDSYLEQAIHAKYAVFEDDPQTNGNMKLSLNVVADMIRYFANSARVKSLYLVKLCKMLWYADMLSYKRRGHAISGLVYRALPMGAVPVDYGSIIELDSIHYEEKEVEGYSGKLFPPVDRQDYKYLTSDDKEILDVVADCFGNMPKSYIVEAMHQEDAYIETKPKAVIEFRFAETLSLT